jgi:hypothetical protein
MRIEALKERSTALLSALLFFFLIWIFLDKSYNCFLAIWRWEILLSWQSRVLDFKLTAVVLATLQ